MLPGNLKERQLAEREKDEVDIQQAAELAETAAAFFAEAEEAVRAEGSAYSLARFAYQVQKSGLRTDNLFNELRQRLAKLEDITKEKEPDKNTLDWALMAIASWQYLVGQDLDAEKTLRQVSSAEIRENALRRVAVKFIEQKKDPGVFLREAEKEIDTIEDEKERLREANALAGDWASAGNRREVERVIKKYYPDNPDAQQEGLVDYARLLNDQGVPVEDIFLEAFRSEGHVVANYYKENLIEGLIQTGQYNEAMVVLLEQPGGDTSEAEKAWAMLAKAQADGDQAVATSAWKKIASASPLDPDLVKTAGIALARAGEEAGANTMITVLQQIAEETPQEKKHRVRSIAHAQDLIKMANALQFITKKRPETEKRKLVSERFHQPLAAAVKDVLVKDITDPVIKFEGLRQLAGHLANSGSNPNMFKIVDEIEHIFAANTEEFASYQKFEIYLELAEQVAKGLAVREGSMKESLRYVQKAIDVLKEVGNFPPSPYDYLHERLWVAKTRIASAATRGAKERLTRGTKTKTKTSAQLNRLNISPAGKKLIAAIRPTA